MPPVQRFRSAFNGFNRNDVVQYIEYLNNHYQSQIQQLNNQLANASSNDELEQLRTRCAHLEAQLAGQMPAEGAELEAYRRAEKAERLAKERAQKIYDQANGALAEATAKAEEAAKQIGSAAEFAAQQLNGYAESILSAKASMEETAQILAAACPETE